MALEWRRQGREVNAYDGPLRPYRIVPVWCGSGVSVRSYLTGRATWCATEDEAIAWAEEDEERFHREQAAWRNRGERIK